jgi:hypothetical protein
MLCPVQVAIKEIRGAGLHSDGKTSCIKVGGSSGCDYICDDMSYVIMTRKMEFARFKLARPDIDTCRQSALIKDAGIDYTALYTRLITRTVLKKKYLYDQFVQLINLLGRMEPLIIARIRRAKSLNISIPDIILLPQVDQLILYRTDILCATMNQIIDYMNNLNINSLLNTPIVGKIARLEPGKFNVPDMKTKICELSGDTADEYLAVMEIILNHEIRVAEYIREIEKYHCTVINHMNQVYDRCKALIADLCQ